MPVGFPVLSDWRSPTWRTGSRWRRFKRLWFYTRRGWSQPADCPGVGHDRETVAKYVRAEGLCSKTSQSAPRLGGRARMGGPGRVERASSGPLSEEEERIAGPAGSSAPRQQARRQTIQNRPKRPSGRRRFRGVHRSGRSGLPDRWLATGVFGGGRFPGEGVRSQCLRALSAGDPGEVGAGAYGPADLPGPGPPTGSSTSTTACGGSWPSCGRTSPLPFRRMECEAGEEAQVDFGTGAWIDLPNGKRRRSARLSLRAELQPQGLQRGASLARPRRTSSAVWRTPSGTSAACRRCW